MAQIVYASSIFQKIGCMDPLASNYDPTATEPCNGCCEYGQIVVGCLDPLAVNYNSSANAGPANFDTVYSPLDLPVVCEGPYQIAIDGQVLGVTSVDCCNITAIGPVAEGHEYYWDGRNCYYRPIIECPADIVCVDCNNFDWWNDTYIVNHGGQSLQTSNPVLWQHLVDVVTNSGQTFYVQISTGNLLDVDCCPGVWDNGVCFCNQVVEEDYEPKCINTLQQFLDFYSTTEGYNYLVSNATSVGGGLGLTNTQFNFVLANLFNSNDNNGNGVSDLTEARLLITNALSVTGGFYVNFGTITNNPIVVTKGICDSIGGYWDTSSSQCMCQPVVDQCEIDITQVQVISTTDFYNNPIQIVGYKDKDEYIGEACCNRLIKDYNLPWEWQSPWCYAVPKEDCLPVQFSLNNENMTIPACSNSLELSMWVYFGKPSNPCQPIPDPPDDDIIVIDGEVCDITLTPNTGVIVTTGTTGGGIEVGLGTEFVQRSIRVVDSGTPVEPVGPIGTGQNSITCCYSIFNPILARITTTDPLLNASLVQVKEYNSSTDYFDKWVQIKATLPTSGLTLNFGIYLEIYQGLNCCCNYDIFIDDIRVDCPKDESLITYNNVQCPGFEITRVIDNKKSWVYNPGTPLVGISEYDNIERGDGDFGMLNGEGNINRTFAPSLDADIPWRYTDYWVQSSVLERHSNLVLNSKELGLTFDMCADCPISGTTLACPSGYTLSAGTTVCYQTINYDCNNNNLVVNGTFDVSTTGWTITPITNWVWKGGSALYTGVDEGGFLQQDILTSGVTYQISFDLYWDFADPPCGSVGTYVQVYAGNVTSSSIYVSGHTTVSLTLTADNVTFSIFAVDACSPNGVIYVDNICVIPASSTIITTSATTEPTVTYLNLYDLENYKKTFQSFWIPFMEQFIPATTIWVAGERWCNEPCTIIDVCDYDFELTEAEISIEPIQPGFLPSTPRSVGSSAMPVPTTSTSTTTSSSEPTGSIPTETPYIMPIKELGLVRETVLIPTTDQLSVDLTSSRFRFSDVTTEIVT